MKLSQSFPVLAGPRRAFLAAALSLVCVFGARAQSSVTLSWTTPTVGKPSGYALYMGAASGNYSTRLDVGTNLAATITGLTAGRTNYFVATAYNAARVESPASNEAQFVTAANVPVTPPTNAPPTNSPPTNSPTPTNTPTPTNAPPTNSPPTNSPVTNSPTPTNSPTTNSPSTNSPAPTNLPAFGAQPLQINNTAGSLLVSSPAATNRTWVLQASADLMNWTSLFTNAPGQPLGYAPPSPTAPGWCYFRAVAVSGTVNATSITAAITAGNISANAVGYVRVDAAPRGNTLVANPFNTGNNTLAALVPSAPGGTVLYKYSTGVGYTSTTYFLGGWTRGAVTLNPGEGSFLYNPSATPLKLLFAGQVAQGTVTNVIPTGYSITSPLIPLTNALATLPGAPGDQIQCYNTQWISYTNIAGAWVGNPANGPLVLQPGTAIFINKTSAARWVQSWSPTQWYNLM